MAKIRDDLDGVVFIPDAVGSTGPLRLAAGDEVPDGVTVGDHLLAEPTETGDTSAPDETVQEPPREGRGSGVKAWQEYAAAVGIAHPAKATRDEIVELVDAAKSDATEPADDPEDAETGDEGDGEGDGDDTDDA